MWFHTHSCIICRPTLDPIFKEKLKSTCIICTRNFTMWLHKSVVIILATQLPWWRPRWWPSRLTATTLDERCADANIFPSTRSLRTHIVQLTTSKVRIRVRYLTQGSVRIRRGRWVKAYSCIHWHVCMCSQTLQAWLLQLCHNLPKSQITRLRQIQNFLACCCQCSQIQSHHSHPLVFALVKDNWAHWMQAPFTYLQSSHNHPTFISA